MTIQHNNETIEVNIIRSNRTTACIRIQPDGSVEVRGPRLMPDSFVREFVLSKAEWIIQKRQEVAEHQSKKRTHTYQSGDVFLYLGEEYVLSIQVAGRRRVELTGDKLVVYTTSFEPEAVKKQLQSWYRKEAELLIHQRIEHYAQFIPEEIESVSMENRKNRWGSCSSKGELTFNWRLSMAPMDVVDYVVVHEMCHLKHMDHSPNFWKAVGKVLPDYKKRIEWLKEQGMGLNL